MDVSQIGSELGADNLVQGSIQGSGDRLRMTVRLLNAQTGRPIWSDKYDRRMGDIFAVQNEIAQKIARALKVKVSDQEKNAIAEKSTEDVKAYTLYLQGRLSLSKRAGEDLKKAIELFESAVKEDPMYGLARAGIAESYFELASRGLMPSNECYPRALESASRAVLLDETLADAHGWLGAVKFYFEYNMVSAEMELLRAIELNPAYAPAHSFLAFILISTGRRDQAISEMELARDLDPLSARINADVGLMYINARRYDQAIDILNKTTEKFPEEQNAAKYLGAAYFFKSMYEQAAEIFQKAGCRSDLGIALVKMERKTEAQKIVKELVEESRTELIGSYEVAKLYFSMGDVDQGFNWLNRAYAERGPSIYMMKVDPFLDSVRSDQRYHELLKRMNLE
jgi:tetratricopeptide (TPR) repeat protein